MLNLIYNIYFNIIKEGMIIERDNLNKFEVLEWGFGYDLNINNLCIKLINSKYF